MTDKTQNPYREALDSQDAMKNATVHVDWYPRHGAAVTRALSIAAELHDNLEELEDLVEAGEKATTGEWAKVDGTDKYVVVNHEWMKTAANTRPIIKSIMERIR